MSISAKRLVYSILACGGLIWATIAINQKAQLLKNGEISSWVQSQSLDCAVVLTGGTSRIREGFDLLSQNKIKLLIISGVNPAAHLREIFPMWPFYPGVSEEKLILEKESSTTYSNGVQSFDLARKNSCKQIFLITSQIHMPRAKMIFQNIFLNEIEVVPHAVSAGTSEEEFLSLVTELIKGSVQKILLMN